MSIEMKRDPRDVWPRWPAEMPPGTYDIETMSIEKRPAVTHRIDFICPHGKRCGVWMGPKPEDRPYKGAPYVWGWDGNIEKPTLHPSINCRTHDDEGRPTGGCGWHGFIQQGVMK